MEGKRRGKKEDENKREEEKKEEVKKEEKKKAVQEFSYDRERLLEVLQSKKGLFTLDISHSQLLNINNLHDYITQDSGSISKLDISNNMIVCLNLSNFDSLVYIDASYNHLYKVNISCKNLQYLNLNFNCLAKIPKLEGVKKLEELYLNSNNFTDFPINDVPESLTKLYFANNRIQFCGTEIDGWVSSFCRLKCLQKFCVEGNPFEKDSPSYKKDIPKYCPEVTEVYITKKGKEEATEQEKEKKNEKDPPLPTLIEMAKSMRDAMKSEGMCELELDKLLTRLKRLKNSSRSFDHVNNEKKNDGGEFFEALEMLHSNQPKHRKEIYKLLTYLVFTQKCSIQAIRKLSQFMQSDKEMVEVLKILDEEVIRDLGREVPKNWNYTVLEGICILAEQYNISELLKKISGDLFTISVIKRTH